MQTTSVIVMSKTSLWMEKHVLSLNLQLFGHYQHFYTRTDHIYDVLSRDNALIRWDKIRNKACEEPHSYYNSLLTISQQ